VNIEFEDNISVFPEYEGNPALLLLKVSCQSLLFLGKQSLFLPLLLS
jgi:hypothetical protein